MIYLFQKTVHKFSKLIHIFYITLLSPYRYSYFVTAWN